MKKLLLLFVFYCSLAYTQEAFYTFDMTEILSNMEKSWSIGNGINLQTGEFEHPYFEVVVYPQDNVMNMNGHHLEIMNTKITVVGDTINSYGGVTKRFFGISELIVEGETLTVPQQEDFEIKMYPNPATDYVTLKGQYIEELQIYDMNGKIVGRAKPKKDNYKIDVRSYAKGTYVLRILFQENRGTYKKLIVN